MTCWERFKDLSRIWLICGRSLRSRQELGEECGTLTFIVEWLDALDEKRSSTAKDQSPACRDKEGTTEGSICTTAAR